MDGLPPAHRESRDDHAMEQPEGDLHGASLRRDLEGALGRRRIQSAVRDGLLRRWGPRVLIDAVRVLDVRTRAAAALISLGERSVIAGQTACWLHGCAAADTAVVHVVVPYGHPARTRPDLVVHNGTVGTDDVMEVDRLRVLTLGRAVSDVLCTVRERDAFAITDQALALQAEERREGFRAEIRRELECRRDPRGTRRAGYLVDLCTGRAESPPESWLLLTLVDGGFPVPEANWWLHAPSGVALYRLDLAWPMLRICLEYDGYAVHAERAEQDRSREEDLERRGWIVVRARADDLGDTTRVERELRCAFERRGYRWW